MMSESDLAEIPSDLIRVALCEIVEEKLKSKNYKIDITSASKAGESNFIGIVHRVSFGKTGENEQEKMILKVAPQHLARRQQFNSRPLFLQEIAAYNEVNLMKLRTKVRCKKGTNITNVEIDLAVFTRVRTIKRSYN